MNILRTQEWEDSYSRKENFIFYPKEEVVKFLNRYIRKKTGLNKFVSHLKSKNKLRALDLGCGIGRQTILFEEFNIEGYGVDISEVALTEAKKLAEYFGYDLSERLIQLKEVALPFEDNFFDFAISDSVLDSMEFSFAQEYMRELNRTVKKFLYLNLISGDSVSIDSGDVEVTNTYEQGTIQSYYSLERVQQLIADTEFQIASLHKIIYESLTDKKYTVRLHIVLTK